MYKQFFYRALTLVGVAVVMASCSRESSFGEVGFSKEDALANAEMKLGLEIDPSQDWVMTETMAADVTVALGLDERYTVALYDENPLFSRSVHYYARTVVAEGETKTLQFTVPKGRTTYYAAVFDSQLRRMVKVANAEAGQLSVVFGNAAKSRTRATEAEWTGTDPAYAHTMMDYLSITEWSYDAGNQWWHNIVTLTGNALTQEEMLAYPELTDDLIANWTSNNNHTLSDQSWKYDPAQFPGGGDGKHFYVKPGTEISLPTTTAVQPTPTTAR